MENEPKKILGLRTSALLEIALFLLAALTLDLLLGSGNRFWDINPHPFWIIVLLVAAQYGTGEGLAAAAASTVALLLFNMPEQGIQQNIYDYLYMVAKTPLLWVIAGVSLGELRMKHIRERREMQAALTHAQEREEKIAESYEWVRASKDKLELRIAGQLRSGVAAYQAARAMDTLTPDQVLRGLAELVSAAMNPERFSIYTLDGEGLTLSFTQGWREQEPLNRRFAPGSDLYRAITASRQMLAVSNPEHERVLAGQGVLAGSLIDRASGEVVGMLKIESIGFTGLNLSSIETFAALCEWAGMSLANARKYQTAKDGSLINPDHNLYTQSYFARHSEYITALGKRVGFDVTMVVAKLMDASNLSTDVRTAVARALSEAVNSVLRGVDLAFDYQGNAEEYSIVLPATNRAGAEIVAGKIRDALNTRLTGAAMRAQIAFSLQSLHQK